jgi:hypothetical protein
MEKLHKISKFSVYGRFIESSKKRIHGYNLDLLGIQVT